MGPDPYDDIVSRLKAHANDADNCSDSYVGAHELGHCSISDRVRWQKRGP